MLTKKFFMRTIVTGLGGGVKFSHRSLWQWVQCGKLILCWRLLNIIINIIFTAQQVKMQYNCKIFLCYIFIVYFYTKTAVSIYTLFWNKKRGTNEGFVFRNLIQLFSIIKIFWLTRIYDYNLKLGFVNLNIFSNFSESSSSLRFVYETNSPLDIWMRISLN